MSSYRMHPLLPDEYVIDGDKVRRPGDRLAHVSLDVHVFILNEYTLTASPSSSCLQCLCVVWLPNPYRTC